jgi:hypothetical protein
VLHPYHVGGEARGRPGDCTDFRGIQEVVRCDAPLVPGLPLTPKKLRLYQ